jgi:hypothetical protein
MPGMGWNGELKPSGNVAVQTLSALPDEFRYCTDAEIGGSVKRPADARHTVSADCVYVALTRGDQ